MRPAEVTTTQIIVAGIQLEKSGKAVNGFSLRKQIGAGNPARLKRVWDASAATRGSAQNESSAICEGESAINTPVSAQGGSSTPAEVAALREQVQALQSQLEASLKEAANLLTQVQQTKLVVDAVTDDRNKFKERCAELEGKANQQQQRIAELHARIDEQRGELNRGSQSRIALQKALDALLDPTKPPAK